MEADVADEGADVDEDEDEGVVEDAGVDGDAGDAGAAVAAWVWGCENVFLTCLPPIDEC